MASSVLVDKGNNSKVTAKLIEYFLKLDSTKLLDSSTHNNNNNNNWPPDIDRTQLASAYCNICTGIFAISQLGNAHRAHLQFILLLACAEPINSFRALVRTQRDHK